MKILITGIAGLLGSHLSRYFLSKGYTVIGIDDLSGGYEEFIPTTLDIKFYKRAIGKDSISDIFAKHKPNIVYHFAAYAAEGLSPFIRCYNYQNNIIASAAIINECIKHDSKLIFTSSMAVYGDQEAPFTELMAPCPIDPYGIAKYAVEMDIKQANLQFGLRYNIIRPHNVLGIYQNIWDKYRNVIGIFIRKTINKEPMIVYGDGYQTRAFSDIDFYLEPFSKLSKDFDGETFNIGADKYYTLNEVADIVKEIGIKNGFSPEIIHGESRHEVKHAYCDHKKAKEMLDFKDETSLYDLIDKMFNWAISEPKREVLKFNYEIENNIYSYWK